MTTPNRLPDRAAKVELLLLDVDGVLTDGAIVYADDGTELKRFHVRDGSGLKLWQLAGRRAAIVSGRNSPAVARRAAELGVAPVLQGRADKLAAFEALLAETGLRPIELLAETGCLGPHATVVHATHADAHELDLLAEAGSRVCVCPTTEANLGDGFCPVEEICQRGIGICIGSDSNVRIDPLEELRELEGIARRQVGRRNVLSTERLLCYGADEGAGALGLERWGDVAVDLEHRSLRGLDDGDVFSALVFGCSAEVLSSG